MTIVDPNLINDINGALQKLDDANDKLCEVYIAPSVSVEDHLQITRALNHIAEAKLNASATLPPVP